MSRPAILAGISFASYAPYGDAGMDRHFGLALRAVARRVLSAGTARARRAEIRGRAVCDDRAQRELLFAAEARVLQALVRAGAVGLRVRDQGVALHHTHAAVARRRDSAREFLRLGRARARGEARAATLAAAADVEARRRAAREVFRAVAAHDERGREARAPAR